METFTIVFFSILGALLIPLIIFSLQSFTERVILHRKMLRVIEKNNHYYVQYRFFLVFWVYIDNDVAHRITKNWRYDSYTEEYNPAEFSEYEATQFCEKVKNIKVEKVKAKKFKIKKMYR